VLSNKTLPQSPDTEKLVLASMLGDARVCDQATEVVSDEYFCIPEHKSIYGQIRSVLEKGLVPDLPTVSQALKLAMNEQADSVLWDIAIGATTTNITHHCAILRECAIKRGLIQQAQETLASAYIEQNLACDLLNKSSETIFKLGETRTVSQFEPVKNLVMPAMDEIESFQRGPVPGIVKTRFEKIDQATGGLNPGDLVIIAGRPSMGKTAFALSIARKVSAKYPVAVFSLEMTKKQLMQRLICAEAEVESSRVRAGKLTKDEYDRLGLSVGNLHNLPIYIDDTEAITHVELRAKSRRIKRKENIGLIILDYIQLMAATHRGDNRQAEVSEISRNLKSIAKEIGVPMIALSQLSRAVEQRGGDKLPNLSDLRDSGSIEQDADGVWFVHRDYYYNPDQNDMRNVAKIIIAKQRNGPVGTHRVSFIPEYAKFGNLIDKGTETQQHYAGNF
jgi:replicative DNA helicase